MPTPQLPSVDGEFVELNCAGPIPRFVVKTSGATVSLLMAEPNKVIISGLAAGMIDLNCGPQKSALVRVQYEPAQESERGIQGAVRAITFQPVPGARKPE